MLRTILLVCMLGALLVPATVAQEPSPPPADAPVQDARQIRKEQRRERLRRLFDRAVDAVEQQPQAPRPESLDAQDDGRAGKPAAQAKAKDGTGPTAPGGANAGRGATAGGLLNGILPLLRGQAAGGQPGAAATPLEASKLNEAMEEEILRPLAEQFPAVERLQLRFDPQQTDFARDRIGLRAVAALRSTPWGSSAQLNLNVSARIDRRPQRAARAVIGFDIDLLTDVVGLVNFAKGRAVKKAHDTQRQHGLAEGEAALLDLLETTPDFASLTDVADLLPRIGEVNLYFANRKVNRLRAEIASSDTGEVDRQLVEELAETIKQRDNLLAFSIRIRRAGGIDVQEMLVMLPGGGISFGFVSLESVNMQLTESGLIGQVEVSVGQSGVLLYQGAKALVIEPTLRRLQQRDPRTLQNFLRRGRDIGKQLEELPGTPEEIEPLPAPQPQ
jgi:hypothetical protein